ncbi:hypothetical protein C8247_11435 [Paracidovorax avenae]|uniref:hypothetical protein n=1 Tax=Paracidovorax avenae TaxID=80867 RepID=UPI000D17076E|nr:hypothetical protein [Paracidovorax avenae]AVS70981.1 hypothetical protein C8247_11435 [Paracidovorax avenae]
MVRAWLERMLRPEQPTSEPPADVLAAIESAHIVPRAAAGDDAPRAIVMLPGRRGFVLTRENAEAAISATWPNMNAPQVQRAAQFLLDRAALVLRESAQATQQAEDRPKWRDWKPLQQCSDLPDMPAGWRYGG